MFLADGDNEFVNITDIAHRLDKMKLVIETRLESLEELDLVSRGGEYREFYRLSKKGRELVTQVSHLKNRCEFHKIAGLSHLLSYK